MILLPVIITIDKVNIDKENGEIDLCVDDPVLPYSRRRPLSGASCCDSRSTAGHGSWLTVSIPSIVSPTPTILFSPWAATFAWAG